MKIFVVSYAGGHLNNLLPIVKSLRSSGAHVDFLVAPMAERLVAKHNIEYMSFSTLATPKDFQTGISIVDKIHNPIKQIDYKSSLAYAGINMNDLVESCGLERANTLFNSFGVRAFFPYHFMLRILDIYEPDIVLVTHTAARAEKAMLYAAKKKKITVVAVEDLLGHSLTFSPFINLMPNNEYQMTLLKSSGVPDNNIINPGKYQDLQYIATTPSMGLGGGILYGKSKHLADYVITGFSPAKDNLVRCGYHKDQIKMFGVPSFDALYKAVYKRTISKEGVKKNRLLVTSQAPYTEHHITLLQHVTKIALKFPLISILIKPHPSSNGIIERKVIQACGLSNIQLIEGDFQSLLPSIDCLITEYSTTGLEAIVYGIDVIIYRKSEDSAIPFEQLDGVTITKDYNQLVDAIHSVLNNDNVSHFNDDIIKMSYSKMSPAEKVVEFFYQSL
jgi:hypothetical protein